MSAHGRLSLEGQPTDDQYGGSTVDGRYLMSSTMEDFGTGIHGASSTDSNQAGTISALVHVEVGANSGSNGDANTKLLHAARARDDLVDEGLRESLLSKALFKGEARAGEPTFDSAANPSSFESQSSITKLVYRTFNLQWHESVFDKHAPMAPQMYVLHAKVFDCN